MGQSPRITCTLVGLSLFYLFRILSTLPTHPEMQAIASRTAEPTKSGLLHSVKTAPFFHFPQKCLPNLYRSITCEQFERSANIIKSAWIDFAAFRDTIFYFIKPHIVKLLSCNICQMLNSYIFLREEQVKYTL